MAVAIPFEPKHLCALRAQPMQVNEVSLITPGIASALADGDAWSIYDDEMPLFCGGIVEGTQSTGYLWAFVSGEAGPRMRTITRMCARYLAMKRLRRIETSARADFAAGCRWAKLLGFENEGLMRKYGADGSDHYRYARISYA